MLSSQSSDRKVAAGSMPDENPPRRLQKRCFLYANNNTR